MFTDKNNTQNSSDIEVASQEETPKKDDSQKSPSQEIKIEEVKAEGEVKEEPINEEVPKTSIKEITDENFQEKVLCIILTLFSVFLSILKKLSIL